MKKDGNKEARNPIVIVFSIQIILLLLLAFLFLIGRFFEGVNLGAFFFSIVIGALGASVSVFRRIKTKPSTFRKEFSDLRWWSVLMPVLYGTVLTGIGYLIFVSGIFSGDGGNGLITTNLFPNFSKTQEFSDDLLRQFMAIKPSSMQDTGKLLVWSFVAGYSETYVARILNQLEKTATVGIE